MFRFISFSCISIVLIDYCVAIINSGEMSINVDDILNEKLMPMSIFVIEAPTKYGGNDSNSNSNSTGLFNNITNTVLPDSVGDVDSAYSIMKFHRKMINNYMCTNYVAKQILTNVAPHQFQHRMGNVPEESGFLRMKQGRSLRNGITDAMLYDQGSRAYKDWLTKTATLSDIYKHINGSTGNTASTDTAKSPPFRRIDGSGSSNEESEYEEGTISGYAIKQPIPSGFVPPNNNNHLNDNFDNHESILHQQHFAGINKAVSSPSFLLHPFSNQLYFTPPIAAYDFRQNYFPLAYGVSNFNPYINNNNNDQNIIVEENSKKWKPFEKIRNRFRNFFGRNATEQMQEEQPQQGYSSYDPGYEEYGVSEESDKKEMTIKKLYELALVAIAYLSFGIFILQVIMCITATKTHASMMMMPADMGAAEAAEFDTGEFVEAGRRKRSIPSSVLPEINEVSRKVLMSIEAGLIADNDNGNCLKLVLCENNKFARQKNDNQKIWIPIWGLGMSWISSRMIRKQSQSTSILECLKASAIGLGNGDCTASFACDLDKLQNYRKSRRRKRSLGNYQFLWKI